MAYDNTNAPQQSPHLKVAIARISPETVAAFQAAMATFDRGLGEGVIGPRQPRLPMHEHSAGKDTANPRYGCTLGDFIARANRRGQTQGVAA